MSTFKTVAPHLAALAASAALIPSTNSSMGLQKFYGALSVIPHMKVSPEHAVEIETQLDQQITALKQSGHAFANAAVRELTSVRDQFITNHKASGNGGSASSEDVVAKQQTSTETGLGTGTRHPSSGGH